MRIMLYFKNQRKTAMDSNDNNEIERTTNSKFKTPWRPRDLSLVSAVQTCGQA